ncbi:MAG: SDR family oxidoreductase [Actinobacteria bacterium]|nr:SDR family oxidoreductase [Actinomycetota bacterium]
MTVGLLDVRDQGVVVTGAGRGIGLAIAAKLAEEGARVVVNDLDAAEAHEAAAEIGGFAIPGDAASEEGVEALITAARAHLGDIDIYFANAGTAVGVGLDSTEEAWATALEVNVMAHVRAARLLVPTWLERGGGRFVVTASAAGLLATVGNAPYSVSKHSAVGFAEWLAITYGHRGITVQAICPQGVTTRMLDEAGPFKELLARDGALSPEQVAESVWQGLQEGEFLILPHPEVREYYVSRAAHTDRWIGSMQRIQRKVDEGSVG